MIREFGQMLGFYFRSVTNVFDRINELVLKKISPSGLYPQYLRKKGVTVGEGTMFFGSVKIDVTRPYLVEIGRNCVLTDGVWVLTHGFDWVILKRVYHELLGSSGKVVIEDNVFIGMNSIILPGTRIGKNTIIGAGSIVTGDIPPNSVAVGNPCRVKMSIAEYYEKRKREYIKEAKLYALEIYRKTQRIPKPQEFYEEFPLFLKRDIDWQSLPAEIQWKVGNDLSYFLKSKPVYASFEDFLIDSGIPKSKVKTTIDARQSG